MLNQIKLILPASWSSGKAFVLGAIGLWFKSQEGQVRHNQNATEQKIQNVAIKSTNNLK